MSEINVPIGTRTHELQQVKEMVPEVVQRLDGIDAEPVQQTQSDLERIYREHIEDVEPGTPDEDTYVAYLSMPADDWRTLVGSLGRISDRGLDVWWLRKKLTKRLRTRMEELED